jgi:hypothetical protein
VFIVIIIKVIILLLFLFYFYLTLHFWSLFFFLCSQRDKLRRQERLPTYFGGSHPRLAGSKAGSAETLEAGMVSRAPPDFFTGRHQRRRKAQGLATTTPLRLSAHTYVLQKEQRVCDKHGRKEAARRRACGEEGEFGVNKRRRQREREIFALQWVEIFHLRCSQRPSNLTEFALLPRFLSGLCSYALLAHDVSLGSSGEESGVGVAFVVRWGV